MQVRFLKHFATESATYRREEVCELPDAVAERYIGAGLVEPISFEDPDAAADLIAETDPAREDFAELQGETIPASAETVGPRIETATRQVRETTARRRRG